MAVFIKDPRPKNVVIPRQATVITVSSGSNGTVKDVTVFGTKKSLLCRPSTITQDVNVKSFKSAVLLGPHKRPYSHKRPFKIETDFENNGVNNDSITAVALPTLKQKIPRPPNAFMLFAHDFRRKLAHEYPKESNKDISIRLGKLWKSLSKLEKEKYFNTAREVDAEHKKKFPGYVYNPKEARMRKAQRDQSRGERQQVQGGGPQSRWIKQAYSMNHRQSIVSPIMLAQQQRRLDDNKATIREQVERDTGMLQNFPDYLDLSYPGLNIPSNPNEYAVFTEINEQPWCPYLQNPMQSSAAYLMRNNEIKVPSSWPLSTDYSSEQSNYMQPSPRGSPYQHTNQQPRTDPLLLNGSHQPSEVETSTATLCLPLEPKVERNLSISDEIQPSVHMSENQIQQVPELPTNTKPVPDEKKGLSVKLDVELKNNNGKDSLRLPGFHQAFGSTEIGRFSQPDGFFEAAVQQENEAKMNLTPPLPPPVKRTRASRGGRKSKTRSEIEKWQDPNPMVGNLVPKKEMWPDWNPNLHQVCENTMNSQQRMMNYYPYHEESRPQNSYSEMPYQQQWQQDSGYYDRPNYNQYYQPYYNPPQDSMRSYHDCYPDYYYNHSQNWRNHPYYHSNHFPTPHHHHQNVSYYQQYSEYRHYGYQNSRWAMNREIKYSSGMV